MLVAQNLAADPQNHRPVPVDECRESGLGTLIPVPDEPLEQLTVGQPRGRSGPKQGFHLLDKIHLWTDAVGISRSTMRHF